jgi:hypothetical protein
MSAPASSAIPIQTMLFIVINSLADTASQSSGTPVC